MAGYRASVRKFDFRKRPEADTPLIPRTKVSVGTLATDPTSQFHLEMSTPARPATVEPSRDYPSFKREGEMLVPLSSRDAQRRYALTTNVQTGETYFVEYTDEEERQADRDMAEWQRTAPEREAIAKRQAEEAEKFEASLQYRTRIVAFLDILGWRSAVQSKHDGNTKIAKALGKVLSQLQGVASHFNSLSKLLPQDHKWPGEPVMTQFSDSLVVSVNDDVYGKSALENALLVLTSNLIDHGILLRGGVTRGEIFHDQALVFGPALISAYELESEVASGPRIILSPELSTAWSGHDSSGAVPWLPSPDGYAFFNFLPPFMGNPIFNDEQLWSSRLTPIRNLIVAKANDATCSEGVFAKYLWLAGYFDKICEGSPGSIAPVLNEAMKLRWGAR